MAKTLKELMREASIINIKHKGKDIGTIRHDGLGEYTGSHWDSKQTWASRDKKALIAHIKQEHEKYHKIA